MVIVCIILFTIIAIGIVVNLYSRVTEKREKKRFVRMSPSERRKYQEEIYKFHQWYNC